MSGVKWNQDGHQSTTMSRMSLTQSHHRVTSHGHFTWSHPGPYSIGAVLQESILIWADPTSYLILPSWQQEPCSNLGCVGGPIQRDKMCPSILSIRHPHNKWLSTQRCIADLFLQQMYGLLNILGQCK